MVGWAFSLAMAGNFPGLVMGIWWKRATTQGAIAGMIAGFSLCLFYLVCTRYFPQAGVDYFGMTAMTNPVTGAPVVDITKPIAAAAAQRVGWFGLNNINCGLLGMPLGFAVMIVVSLMTPEPSKEMQAYVDEIRKPRGRTVLEENR
jgi:cation/acetate symporter